MRHRIRRAVIVAAAASAPLAALVAVPPGVAQAAECGVGTVYDAPSNTCVAAPLPPAPLPPPPPPPPPPPWNGDPTPGFSIGICAPIPFVSLCTGI
ncbi:hypothetical protein [Mycolicibacterium vaccae]|uniref:Uncharacterized protein n=1 Tax=Mycolicibacterium vaccae ATCC 25954 TaxID=1194972 RepID=K0UWF8_MYCVA|nr:hypothetical protein [Mycolicibacterium vaccae]EJZ11166.1 hypothetical protein MVAC_06897 [Mycolicibacterium vaccae ATCC 25954]MCV7064186.1 hypothetical protein [Mycolicibacterium vaccae]